MPGEMRCRDSDAGRNEAPGEEFRTDAGRNEVPGEELSVGWQSFAS